MFEISWSNWKSILGSLDCESNAQAFLRLCEVERALLQNKSLI